MVVRICSRGCYIIQEADQFGVLPHSSSGLSVHFHAVECAAYHVGGDLLVLELSGEASSVLLDCTTQVYAHILQLLSQ